MYNLKQMKTDFCFETRHFIFQLTNDGNKIANRGLQWNRFEWHINQRKEIFVDNNDDETDN